MVRYSKYRNNIRRKKISYKTIKALQQKGYLIKIVNNNDKELLTYLEEGWILLGECEKRTGMVIGKRMVSGKKNHERYHSCEDNPKEQIVLFKKKDTTHTDGDDDPGPGFVSPQNKLSITNKQLLKILNSNRFIIPKDFSVTPKNTSISIKGKSFQSIPFKDSISKTPIDNPIKHSLSDILKISKGNKSE